jgi:hypothetical protein
MRSSRPFRFAVPPSRFGSSRLREYAERWWNEENAGDFVVGSCNSPTRPATIYAIEAARLMCAGTPGDLFALRLLRMAVEELERLA